MPTMADPNGDAVELDEIAVFAARENFYTGGGSHHPPLEGDAPEVGDNDPAPQDPDGYMPEPQSCADIAYLLYEYEGKRDQYGAINDFLETIDVVDQAQDILENIFLVAGLYGIANIATGYTAAKAAVEAAATQIVARLGPLPAAAGFGLFVLYLANLGTKGRWDVRIASLKSKQQEWNCVT